MTAEVNPEQGNADDGELRKPIGVCRQVDQQVVRFDDALERRLDERVQALLGRDDPPAVGECLRHVLIGVPTNDLVHDVEPQPDCDLEEEVRPAARQAPTHRGGITRHRNPRILACAVADE